MEDKDRHWINLLSIDILQIPQRKLYCSSLGCAQSIHLFFKTRVCVVRFPNWLDSLQTTRSSGWGTWLGSLRLSAAGPNPSGDFVLCALQPRDTWCVKAYMLWLKSIYILTDRQTVDPRFYMFWFSRFNFKECETHFWYIFSAQEFDI